MQAKSSTPPPLRSSPSRKHSTSAAAWERGWPPRGSCTWPGRMAWTCAARAGWPTAASATPSPEHGPTAGATWWACGRCTCTSTRRGTRTPTPATMPSATAVSAVRDIFVPCRQGAAPWPQLNEPEMVPSAFLLSQCSPEVFLFWFERGPGGTTQIFLEKTSSSVV